MQLAEDAHMQEEEPAACETEVNMAKKKCAQKQSHLKEIAASGCGDVHLQTVMTTIHNNHVKTQEQQHHLLDAERQLKMLQSQLGGSWSIEHKTESRVVHQLVQLKAQQRAYTTEVKRSESLSADEKSLFDRAQAATAAAVGHASSSGYSQTTSGMRDKAADLFEKYVHKRVEMATLKRQATLSKDGVTKLSEEVKRKEAEAQKAMDAKNAAEAKVHEAKLKVDHLTTMVTQSEVDGAKLELAAAEEEKKVLHEKIVSTHTTVTTTTNAMSKSETKVHHSESLASKALHMVKETEDMSLKALLAQSMHMHDEPWK